MKNNYRIQNLRSNHFFDIKKLQKQVFVSAVRLSKWRHCQIVLIFNNFLLLHKVSISSYCNLDKIICGSVLNHDSRGVAIVHTVWPNLSIIPPTPIPHILSKSSIVRHQTFHFRPQQREANIRLTSHSEQHRHVWAGSLCCLQTHLNEGLKLFGALRQFLGHSPAQLKIFRWNHLFLLLYLFLKRHF